MSTNNNNTCANCGKGEESSDGLKACTACKMVKYCNRDCQIAHRPQHKKECRKRAAKLHDEALFKEPPRDECPICMLPPPLYDDNQATTGVAFYSCCGKRICDGCIYAMAETGGKNGELCAYCRTPYENSDEEEVERTERLIGNGNADALYQFGGFYKHGTMGLPQDEEKAIELWLKAGVLGCADAYFNLGIAYDFGRGVAIDKKKANHYYELAAINGNVMARHNLGIMEGQAGNRQRAFKHLVLAARAGFKVSLESVKDGYKNGYITKEEYANTLRAYQRAKMR